MTIQFLSSDMSAWYRPDRRRATAPNPDDFVHSFKFNRSKRINGWFQSFTTQSSHPFYSQNELKMLRIADLSPFSVELRAQPPSLEFDFRGKLARYTPDLWIRFVNGQSVLIEVKPSQFAFEEYMVEFFKAAAVAAAATGSGFKVFTDTYLEQEPRQRNVNHLQAFRSVVPDPAFAFLVDLELSRVKTSTLERLSKLHRDPQLGHEMLLALVLRKHLQLNLMQEICQGSSVSRPKAMKPLGEN